MGTRGRRRQLKSISHFPPLLQQPHLKSNFISSFPSQGKKKKIKKINTAKSAFTPLLASRFCQRLAGLFQTHSRRNKRHLAPPGEKIRAFTPGLVPPPLPKAAPAIDLPRYCFFPGTAAVPAPAPAGFIPVSCLSRQVSARIALPPHCIHLRSLALRKVYKYTFPHKFGLCAPRRLACAECECAQGW